MTELLRTEIVLRLEVEGAGSFALSGYNSVSGMGMIPSASCTLAIGRNVSRLGEVAAIHQQGGNLTEMAKAQVIAQIQGDWSDQADWPSGEVVVFDGRLTGIAMRKVQGQIQFIAHLIHWAADLSFSSTTSEQSHPSNPSKLTYRAVHRFDRGGGKANRGPGVGISNLAGAGTFVKQNNVLTDLWGDALHPFFCALAGEDTILVDGRTNNLASGDQKNDLALEALKRFEGGDSACGIKRSEYTPKLTINETLYGGMARTMARAITQSILRDAVESYVHTTLWDLLVGSLGPRFMFTVVPLVDKAIVVPVTPGIRDIYDREILVEDYDYVDLSAFIPRPVRGVGIFGQKEFRAGFRDPNGGAAATRLGIGGQFIPDEDKKGMILFKAGPPWLANIPVSYSAPSKTTGVKGRLVTGSATTPPPESADTAGNQEGLVQGEAAAKTVNAYNEYARALYVMEALRGRGGMIKGKLRFDIAPGSTIKIGGSTEQFIGAEDALGQDLIGMVARVSVGMNAEMGQASTAFQMVHLRTESENQDDATSVEQHPLYSTKFVGAPLVDAYKI